MNKKLLEKVSKIFQWKKSDSIICVDRTVRPVYSNFVKSAKHSELELTGPAQFDVRSFVQWFHPLQKEGYVVIGHEIYEKLLEEKLLESCLNLADLQAIQATGVMFFRKYLADKVTACYAWKSVGLYGEDLLVPYVFEKSGSVKLDWTWISYEVNVSNPVLLLN